jgi:uncharacterized membrane protein
MLWLVIGLVVFLGAHVFSSLRVQRERLIAKIGAGPYKGLYSLLSLAGFVLIAIGMGRAEPVALWTAPEWGRIAAFWITPFAFVSLVSGYVPGNFKRVTAHPMLWGVALWALAHLLANGDLAGLLLFGGFGLYALYAMWSQTQRGATPSQTRRSPLNDLLAIAIGLALWAAAVYFHASLSGVPLVY